MYTTIVVTVYKCDSITSITCMAPTGSNGAYVNKRSTLLLYVLVPIIHADILTLTGKVYSKHMFAVIPVLTCVVHPVEQLRR